MLQSRDICLVLCSGLLFQEITAIQSSNFVADFCLMSLSKHLACHQEKSKGKKTKQNKKTKTKTLYAGVNIDYEQKGPT